MGVERASSSDLAFLAMDGGGLAQQFAVVLILDRPIDPAAAERQLASRVNTVPRLRQKLVGTPAGCGRPIWIDDTAFDIRRHLVRISGVPPGDEQALVDAALALVVTRLPRDRPLWRAALLGAEAVVLVLHHVLADGLGGLAVMARLLDDADHSPVHRQAPPPSVARLAADAFHDRLAAVQRIPRAWRLLQASLAAGGGLQPPRAAPCSLLHPTGTQRSAMVAHADATRVRATAHAYGGTVNSALVAAVTGALHELLATRGEQVGGLAVAVLVTSRSAAEAGRLGNAVSPMLIEVTAAGSTGERIHRIATTVRERRHLAAGPPPIGLLGPVFRLVAALGGYRWYMNRQHRLHTLVSYVRGPEQPVRFGGATVRTMLPLSTGESGNITVSFLALSYNGRLTVTAVADPGRCPDLPALIGALRSQLDVASGARLPPRARRRDPARSIRPGQGVPPSTGGRPPATRLL